MGVSSMSLLKQQPILLVSLFICLLTTSAFAAVSFLDEPTTPVVAPTQPVKSLLDIEVSKPQETTAVKSPPVVSKATEPKPVIQPAQVQTVLSLLDMTPLPSEKPLQPVQSLLDAKIEPPEKPAAETAIPKDDKVPGDTRADVTLQRDIRETITPMILEKNAACLPTIKSTKVTLPPVKPQFNRQGKVIKGDWEELWTVDACGENPEFSVFFMPDGTGGTYFAVEPIE
jgi:hypothetical protein